MITGLEKRLRLAGMFLIAGLLVEAVCLLGRGRSPLFSWLAAAVCCARWGLLCISIRSFPVAKQCGSNHPSPSLPARLRRHDPPIRSGASAAALWFASPRNTVPFSRVIHGVVPESP